MTPIEQIDSKIQDYEALEFLAKEQLKTTPNIEDQSYWFNIALMAEKVAAELYMLRVDQSLKLKSVTRVEASTA